MALENIAADSLTKAGKYAKAWVTFTDGDLYWPYIPVYSGSSNKTEERNIFELREIEESSHFAIYPNPAGDYITIELSENQLNASLRIDILNSVGKKVITRAITGTILFNIDTSGLPSGVYIVSINNGTEEIKNQTIEVIH